MMTECRGLICAPMTGPALDRLRIPQMVECNDERHRTAFTVSVDARLGTTTAISAADRAETIRVLTSPTSAPEDLLRPGHMFPLRAQPGGVLMRRGHTEAAVDLARLAGHSPAGVICEIAASDGSLRRGADLRAFAELHDLSLIPSPASLPTDT